MFYSPRSVVPFAFTVVCLGMFAGILPSAAQTTAPSAYNAYTGTDVKPVPAAPALGAANSVVTDPTFGSRILRVTDANTQGGESFISTDSGFSRTWNANSTAIKLTGPSGDGYWLEFNPSTFQAGTGSGEPALHPLSFGATWEWSAVNPNIIYYLSGSAIETYNTASGTSTPLASTPTGDPVTYMAAVIGLDNWVCAAAGAGSQDTYTKIFCVSPSNPSTYKFIDVVNKTINGAAQTSQNWPTSASGETIGIHDISGGTGPNWLEVTFHQQSWGANGGAVLDLSTNTWSLVTNGDAYWSGHVSMGNGKYENGSGNVSGADSRGVVLRDPDNLMSSGEYSFIMQPPTPSNNWCDAEHSSWLNSLTNANAPILDSRYSATTSCQYPWADEIIAAAVDGSNTVWRFAHNFNGGSQCYYAQAFAQISNDGNWALFSSYWGGTLGPDTSFGCTTRIDTFIVDLRDATGPSSSASATAGSGSSSGTTSTTSASSSSGASSATSTSSSSTGGSTSSSAASSTGTSGSATSGTPAASATATTTIYQETNSSVQYTGAWYPNSGAFNLGGSATLAMAANSAASFTFTGTGVQWIGFSDPWSGIAQVYLDGSLTATIDTYAATQTAQKVQYTVSNLANTSHTLKIVVTGTMDASSQGQWVWVNAFAVTTPAASTSASGATSSSSSSASSASAPITSARSPTRKTTPLLPTAGVGIKIRQPRASAVLPPWP